MPDPGQLLRDRGRRLESAVEAFLASQSEGLARAVEVLRRGTLFVCGNGGSAAHAMHLEAELVGRYRVERPPRPAVYLAMSSASATAIGNDYGFDQVFARALHALARPGDALLALSTSGSSPNVLEVVQVARRLGIGTVLLCGPGGAPDAADVVLPFPGERADLVQDGHQLIIHALMDALEGSE